MLLTEAKDAAKHPTVNSKAPAVENYPSPNVKGAIIEKLWLRGVCLIL